MGWGSGVSRRRIIGQAAACGAGRRTSGSFGHVEPITPWIDQSTGPGWEEDAVCTSRPPKSVDGSARDDDDLRRPLLCCGEARDEATADTAEAEATNKQVASARNEQQTTKQRRNNDDDEKKKPRKASMMIDGAS